MISFKDLKIIEVGYVDLPKLKWAEGNSFCIPQKFFEILCKYFSVNNKGKFIIQNAVFDDEVKLEIKNLSRELLFLRAFIHDRPISSLLPFSYQIIPEKIRTVIAKIIGKCNRFKTCKNEFSFPRWPLDLSVDFMFDFVNENKQLKNNQKIPVILTHDLDTSEGLKNFIDKFIPLESSYGAISTNFIVPFRWKLDYTLLDKIVESNNEIGIHGFDHSNKTPFLDINRQEHRIGKSKNIIDTYSIFGYRAPSLIRTKLLYEVLNKYYRYDSSIPTSGGRFPTANNGCASARPFKIFNLIEFPITLPRDGSLKFLGYSAKEIYNLWIENTKKIANSGGIINLLTHCENRFSGNKEMLKYYEKFISFISKDQRFYFTSFKNLVNNSEILNI